MSSGGTDHENYSESGKHIESSEPNQAKTLALLKCLIPQLEDGSGLRSERGAE